MNRMRRVTERIVSEQQAIVATSSGVCVRMAWSASSTGTWTMSGGATVDVR